MTAADSAKFRLMLEETGATPDQVIELCIGRLLSLGSRAEKPGDTEEYWRLSELAREATDVKCERGLSP